MDTTLEFQEELKSWNECFKAVTPPRNLNVCKIPKAGHSAARKLFDQDSADKLVDNFDALHLKNRTRAGRFSKIYDFFLEFLAKKFLRLKIR